MVSTLPAAPWPASLPAAPTFPGLGPWLNTIGYAKDSLGFAGRLFQQHGPIVSLAAGGGTNFYSPLPDCPGTVIACGPEVVKQVALNHDVFHKFPLTGVLHRYRDRSDRTTGLHNFVVGLFGVNGLQHLQHRRLMMPAFHQRQIEAYRDDMVAITADMLDRVPLHQLFDVATLMRLLTLRIATKTLFGYDMGESGGELGQLLQQLLSMLGSLGVLMLPYDRPGLPFHRFLNRIHDYERAMDKLIAQKRQQANPAHDMLALLIQARDADTGLTLSQSELLGHIGVLFAAGHETSANALTWTLMLLSQHPQVASKLLCELTTVLQGAAPTLDQLKQMPYLDAVVKESLRIITPVPWNGRVLAQPTQVLGYDLPAGTEIMVSLYHTHHQANIYPESERFDPQRWFSIEPSPYEYVPFSAGPRTCIGATFAMVEIKVVLAMLLQRYRLQLLPRTPINRTGFIVLSPKNGLPMVAYAQDGSFTVTEKVTVNVRQMVTW